MNVLVCGARGLVGRAACAALRGRGHRVIEGARSAAWCRCPRCASPARPHAYARTKLAVRTARVQPIAVAELCEALATSLEQPT